MNKLYCYYQFSLWTKMGKNALNKIEEKINQCILNLFLNKTTQNYVNNVKEQIQVFNSSGNEIIPNIL